MKNDFFKKKAMDDQTCCELLQGIKSDAGSPRLTGVNE